MGRGRGVVATGFLTLVCSGMGSAFMGMESSEGFSGKTFQTKEVPKIDSVQKSIKLNKENAQSKARKRLLRAGMNGKIIRVMPMNRA